MLLFLKIMMTEFISEMGDKTQLMLIAMTSKFKMRDILIGTALAVMVLNGLAVLAGGLVGSLIPTWLIKIIAALAFMFFAATSIAGDDDDENKEVKDRKIKLSFLAVFATFFVAELGDKTQLTAITFGANEGLEHALIVWGACSIGLFAADILGMVIGYFLKSRIPEKALNVLAFVIFAIFGIVTMRTGLILLLGDESSAIMPIMIAVTAGFFGICIGLIIRSPNHIRILKRSKTNQNKVLVNGELLDASAYNPDSDASESYIYEVIRIIDGRPLFAKEHYERLVKSLAASGYETHFSLKSMISQINTLARANGKTNDNVKIIVDNFADGDYDVSMLMLNTTYPDSSSYAKGVRTQLFAAVRKNPHIKIRNQSLRDRTNEIIKKNNLFEVILVDENGCITEGSRSNVFFIKNGTVYTSPEGDVLMGVTRQAIIKICTENGISLVQGSIKASSVKDFDAAFISGTSPKVLPILSIGDITMDVKNPTLIRLMALYDDACRMHC